MSDDERGGSSSMLRAQAAVEARRWDIAEALLREAIREDPENAEAYALLAVSLINLSRFKEALHAIDIALRMEPGSGRYHRMRSSILIPLAYYRNALEEADEALRLEPEVSWGHHLRAKALGLLGRQEEAAGEANKALEMDPEEEEHHELLGDLFLKSDPKKAEAFYRRSLSIDPCQAKTLNNLGVALMKQKRTLEAAFAFKAAVLVDPTLKVAKENVRSSVEDYIKIGTIGSLAGGVAILYSLKNSLNLAEDLLKQLLYVLLIMALIGLALGLLFLARYLRLRKVRKLDPQLLAIYKKIEEDHRAGRLRR